MRRVHCAFVLGCTPELRERFPSGWPAELDYGLYWWGRDFSLEKATPFGSKLYDPSKPTVIDIHGWVGFMEWTKACFRTSVQCDICADKRSLMEAWFDQGWNVGLFYWDQFADEPHACDAERKIYFHHKNLRWLSNEPEDGPDYFARTEFKDFPGSTNVSVADLCAQNIADVMHDYVGPEVRFVGHSMGTQLAIRCAALLHQTRASAAPKRLVLTEAAFVLHPKIFGCGSKVIDGLAFGDWAVQTVHQTMKQLVDWGVFTEYIQTLRGKTRMMIDGVESKDLEMQSVSVQYTPEWCHNSRTKGVPHYLPFLCTHDAAHVLYMLSMANVGPCIAPSAACSRTEIASLLSAALEINAGRHPKWIQVSGSTTINTTDDRFAVNYNSATSKSTTETEFLSRESAGGKSLSSWQGRTTSMASQRFTSIGLATILGCCLVLLVSSICALLSRTRKASGVYSRALSMDEDEELES